jgi:single-strand DNA-binding protein
MSNNTITISGNVTDDIDLRHTAGGRAVANFTVADTHRYRDSAGEWVDGETLFQRVVAWDALAENIAASISKGGRVVVTGRMQAKSYTAQDGQTRSYPELQADEVGASLRFATAELTRTGNGRR